MRTFARPQVGRGRTLSTAQGAHESAVRTLWIAVAVTFPLMALSEYRFQFDFLGSGVRMYLPIPVVLLAAIGFLHLTAYAVRSTHHRDTGWVRFPTLLLLVFMAYHFFSALLAVDGFFALREASKVTAGVACLYLVAHCFPRDERLFAKFWTIVIWGSGLLFAALIYQYVFVFQSAYLGSHFTFASREDRNLLTWYLVMVIPFALSHFLFGRHVWSLVPLLVLIVGWLYGGSRGAWLSVTFGLAVVLPFLRISGPSRMLARPLAGLLVLGVLATVVWREIIAYLGEAEAIRRFQYLYDPSLAPELESYTRRWEMTLIALRDFASSPFFGVGLTNSGMTHSDYSAVLSELGLVGMGLFVMVLWQLSKNAWRPVPTAERPTYWIAVATMIANAGILWSFAAINGYNSPLVWIFFGFAAVLVNIERSQTPMGSTVRPTRAVARRRQWLRPSARPA